MDRAITPVEKLTAQPAPVDSNQRTTQAIAETAAAQPAATTQDPVAEPTATIATSERTPPAALIGQLEARNNEPAREDKPQATLASQRTVVAQ